jgi:hypothetical protein
MDNLMDGYAPVHEVSHRELPTGFSDVGGYIKTPDAAAGLALVIQGEFYSEKRSNSSYISLNQFLPGFATFPTAGDIGHACIRSESNGLSKDSRLSSCRRSGSG